MELQISEKYTWSIYIKHILLKDNIHALYSIKNNEVVFLKCSSVQFNVSADIELEQRLIDRGFLVSKSTTPYDENSAFISNLNKIYTGSGVLSFVYFVTKQCNLACQYCFVDHQQEKIESRTNDIVSKIEQIIKKENSTFLKKVSIHYFGGEPLLFDNRIVQINEAIRQSCGDNVSITSVLYTNGTRLTENVLTHVKNRYFSEIRTSLDGTSEIHNARRVFRSSDEETDSFKKTVEMIKLVKDYCKVTIQISIDKENAPYIEKLIDYLVHENIVDESGNVKLSFGRIFPNGKNDNDQLFSITDNEYFKLINLFITKSLRYFPNIIEPPEAIKISCFYYTDKAIIISDDGSIYRCCMMNDRIGNIDNIIDEIPKAKKSKIICENNKCGECKYMPLCSSSCMMSRGNVLSNTICHEWKYLYDNYISEYTMARYNKIQLM